VALRRRSKKDPAIEADGESTADLSDDEALDGVDTTDDDTAADGVSDGGDTHGPLDSTQPARPLPQGWGRIDLGALQLGVPAGVELRLDVDQASGRVNAVLVVLEPVALQLMAYAAPRTLGIWDEVRAEIAASLTGSAGSSTERDGRFGPELLARIAADGGEAEARFMGVDGPRWFLRGVISGPGAHDDEVVALAQEVFAATVVVRDDEARPSQEPLLVTMPRQSAPVESGSAEEGESSNVLSPFERGPEITEIR
jgi:hypothetical protein